MRTSLLTVFHPDIGSTSSLGPCQFTNRYFSPSNHFLNDSVDPDGIGWSNLAARPGQEGDQLAKVFYGITLFASSRGPMRHLRRWITAISPTFGKRRSFSGFLRRNRLSCTNHGVVRTGWRGH